MIVDEFAVVLTTPYAPLVCCKIKSPCVTDTELPKVKLISVIAVKICFDVKVGDAGLFVEVCNPSTSKYTIP